MHSDAWLNNAPHTRKANWMASSADETLQQFVLVRDISKIRSAKVKDVATDLTIIQPKTYWKKYNLTKNVRHAVLMTHWKTRLTIGYIYFQLST
jgi:hypothetical protein